MKSALCAGGWGYSKQIHQGMKERTGGCDEVLNLGKLTLTEAIKMEPLENRLHSSEEWTDPEISHKTDQVHLRDRQQQEKNS